MTNLLIPVIIGLVAVFTKIGIPTRYAPLLAVVFGILSVFVTKEITLLDGIIFGLSSAGLYDVGKVTIAGK